MGWAADNLMMQDYNTRMNLYAPEAEDNRLKKKQQALDAIVNSFRAGVTAPNPKITGHGAPAMDERTPEGIAMEEAKRKLRQQQATATLLAGMGSGSSYSGGQ